MFKENMRKSCGRFEPLFDCFFGGGSAPPPAPDPVRTIAAQDVSNTNTARQNAQYGMMNQNGPNGSVTYAQNGTWSDGTPRYEQNTALSAQGQVINNNTQNAAGNLSGIASDRSNALRSHLNTTADYSQGAIDSRQVGFHAPNANNISPITSNGNNSQASPQSINANERVNTPQQAQVQSINANERVNTPQQAQVQSINANERVSTPQQAQVQSINANERVGMRSIESNNQLEGRLNDLASKRLNPQLDRQQKNMEASLRDRGIMEGSTAWKEAQTEMGQQKNDALNQMILSGQQQAFNQSASRAQNDFGQDLSANTSQFNQAAQANSQNYSQQSDAINRGFQNNLASNQQDFGQRAAAAGQNYQQADNSINRGFQNNLASNQQDFGQRAAAAGQNYQQADNSINRGFQNNLASNQQDFGQRAAAAGQNYSQGLQSDQYNLGREQQQFNQNLASSQNNYNQQLNTANSNFSNNLTGRQQSLQELNMIRQTPINEITQLMGASQQQPLQFSAAPRTQMANTDVAGITQNAFNSQVAAVNAQNQANGSMWGTLGGLAGSIFRSDRRSKENIKPAGKLKDGTNVYSYKYKNGNGLHELGVMAQELAKKHPSMVKTINGVKHVDYGALKRKVG